MRKVVVTGAGGFIGHHLVKYLKQKGYWVRGIDIKHPEFEPTIADEFILADLRFFENCMRAVQGVQDVYHLAADMGGIGYITSNHANLTRNNILIDAHMIEATRLAGVERFLYTSSACVYPSYLQNTPDVKGLREEDAIPADPEKGYGWEKLFAEQLFTYYHEEFGLDVRIVRFHNIYGPLGTYEGGKEKAPAAIMRKVAEAEDGSEIEVWGDGKQTRSFCYIDDCVEGLVRVMDSGYTKPINLGTEELVTIDELVDITCEVAGKRLRKRYNLSAPQGVRGRNSDNSKLREILGWEPQISLREGIERTYPWIWAQLAKQGRAKPPIPKGAEKVP
jgi:nucleoside-diphosphate-sugar epimerase